MYGFPRGSMARAGVAPEAGAADGPEVGAAGPVAGFFASASPSARADRERARVMSRFTGMVLTHRSS